MTDDTLVLFGGAVKSIGNGRVGGYLVQFTGPEDPDLTGEFFTKSTDFWLDEDSPKRRVIWHHGFDPTLKTRSIGSASLRIDDAGVWAEAQLNLADDYERHVEKLVKTGKFRWSSGSAPHLVETAPVGNAKHILSWPIVEATITHRAAEPRASVVSLKSLRALSEGETDHPDAEPVAPPARKAMKVGYHVKWAGGCGEVKELFDEGEHETAAGKCIASKDAPMAHVDHHDDGHKCTGKVKCHALKDLEFADDDEAEATKALKAYEPAGMPPPDARVMVGLWLPPETATALAIPGGEPADSLHLTLCYVGRAIEIGTNAIERLKAVCKDVAGNCPPLIGKVAGMGRFSASDTSDGMDVVYASADLPDLAECRQRLARELEGYGIGYKRTHGFTPHVTLKYVEPSESSPVTRIAPMPLVFDRLCLVIDGEKTFFPFNGGNQGYPMPSLPWRSLPPDSNETPAANAATAGEPDPESRPEFAEHSLKVVSAVEGYASRVGDRLDARVKAGRELSAANRNEIDTVCTALESGVAKLRGILDRTAPAQPDATAPNAEGATARAARAKAVRRLRADLLRIDTHPTMNAR